MPLRSEPRSDQLTTNLNTTLFAKLAMPPRRAMEIDLTLDSGSDDELVVLDETAGGKGDGGTGAGRQRASRSASASGSAAARNGKMNVQSVAVIDSDDEAPKAGKRRRGVTDGKRARDSDGDEDSVVSFGWGGSDVVSGKRGGKRAAKSAGPAKSTNPVPVPAKVLDSDEEACEPDSKYARKKRKQSTVAKARKHKLPKAIPRYGVGASIAPPAPIPFAPPPQLPIIPARVSSTSYRASLASMIPSSWSAMANAAGFPLSSQVAGLASRFYGAPLKPTGPAPALRRVRILRSPSGDLRYADSHNPVSTDDAEDFSSIANQFFHFATEDEGSFKITAIEIVLVEKSLHKYEACRERFASAGREAKEMLVFHGTRAENVEGILGEGFKIGGVDAGVAALNGTAYGNGVYTSTKPETPISYGFNTNRIIVAHALPGLVAPNATHRMSQSSPYDSIMVQGSEWWIFKSSEQLCPRFVVEWERGSGTAPAVAAMVPPAAWMASRAARQSMHAGVRGGRGGYTRMAGRGVPGPMPGSIVTSGSGMSPALTRALAAQASYFPALSYGGVAQPSVGIPVLPPATGTSAFFQSGSHVHYAPIVHSAGGFGAAPPPPPLRAQSTSRAAVTGKGQGKAPTEPIDPAQEVNESEITETINLALEALEPPAYATPAATKAIFKHLSRIVTSQMKRKNPDVLLDFDSLENLYLWNLKFANFAGTRLGASLAQVGAKDIELEIRFGPEFPVRPPFVRVVSPRFVPPIAGGGGHITMGGAICFEALVLTEGPGGWTPKTDLETLLHSIRIGILTANPPAQLDFARWNVRYMLQEARDAYGRQMSRHARDGWKADESMGKWLK